MCVCVCVCVCVCECGVSVIVKRFSLPPCAVSRHYLNPLLLLFCCCYCCCYDNDDDYNINIIIIIIIGIPSVQSRLLPRVCTCKVKVQITPRQTVSVLDGCKVEESVRQSDAIYSPLSIVWAKAL